MSDIVASGKAHYWGTSEWTADEVRAAWHIADKHTCTSRDGTAAVQPVGARARRVEYARLYDDIGLGLTFGSARVGSVDREYLDGIPAGSRGALPGYEWLQQAMNSEKTKAKVRALKTVADDSAARSRTVSGLVREESACHDGDHGAKSRRARCARTWLRSM